MCVAVKGLLHACQEAKKGGGAKVVLALAAPAGNGKAKGAMVKKSVQRLYDDLGKDASAFLCTRAPAGSNIFVDPKNGRWRLSWPTTSASRSVSWTNLGRKVAACVAMRQLWEWSSEFAGKAVPPDISEALVAQGFSPCAMAV